MLRNSLFSLIALGLTVSVPAVTVTIGSITIETDNSVQTATETVTGTNATSLFNAPIQGVGNPDIDNAHHIGTLLGGSPGFAVDLTNGGNGTGGRTTIECTWGANVAVNGTGDDLYIVESGSFNDGSGTGFPEAFAVAVREEGGSFSNYRYEFFEAGDGTTLKLVTAYDFSDFGLASNARVDAIRIISIHNASATTSPNLEDRAIDSSGAGELTLDAGSGTGFAIQQGPISGNPGTFPDGALDADIVYVAAEQVGGPMSVSSWSLYE